MAVVGDLDVGRGLFGACGTNPHVHVNSQGVVRVLDQFDDGNHVVGNEVPPEGSQRAWREPEPELRRAVAFDGISSRSVRCLPTDGMRSLSASLKEL